MRIAPLSLVATTVLLTACASPVPVAQNFPVSYQNVARTAAHWDVIANDVVEQTMQAITEVPQLRGRSVYVAKSHSTEFNKAFREFMITRMVNEGVDVSVCRVSNMDVGFEMDPPQVEVSYETQWLQHIDLPDRPRPGAITALASGVAVLRNAALADLTRGEQNVSLIATAALADVVSGQLTETPQTEIVVTTTIAENNRYVMRRSDIYYVPEADAHLFIRQIHRSSRCPGEPAVAGAKLDFMDTGNTADAARWQQLTREMSRINRGWGAR